MLKIEYHNLTFVVAQIISECLLIVFLNFHFLLSLSFLTFYSNYILFLFFSELFLVSFFMISYASYSKSDPRSVDLRSKFLR